ncbi:MAG: hypothetical protein Q7Q71_01220 [Verrucomicrobiota bacterium JB023]|nr:hypothetical protein [Verrucomicrobiota bacterium JB023]
MKAYIILGALVGAKLMIALFLIFETRGRSSNGKPSSTLSSQVEATVSTVYGAGKPLKDKDDK